MEEYRKRSNQTMMHTVDTFADIRDQVQKCLDTPNPFGDSPQRKAEGYRRDALCCPCLNPARRPMERWAICALQLAEKM